MIDLGHLADPTDPDLLTLRSTMRRRSHTNRWQQRATMALLAAVPGICTAQEGEARAMTELEAVTVTARASEPIARWSRPPPTRAIPR